MPPEYDTYKEMYQGCEQFSTVAQRKDCKIIKFNSAALLTRSPDHQQRYHAALDQDILAMAANMNQVKQCVIIIEQS